VQFGTNVSVVTGKQYAIFFKASADADTDGQPDNAEKRFALDDHVHPK
jgi:hypothetical protein